MEYNNPSCRLVLDFHTDWMELYNIDSNDDYIGDIDEIFESPKQMLDWLKNYLRKMILQGDLK